MNKRCMNVYVEYEYEEMSNKIKLNENDGNTK